MTRSYRAGSWFAIFGGQATVLLPPSEKARVGRLWELVDDGAGFDEVLDALISNGLRQLPGFVLVSEDGSGTKIVIRGAGRATCTADGETVELEGSPATTWVERTLTGVSSLSVQVEDAEPGAHELVVDGGLVRVSRIDEPAVPRAQHRSDPALPQVPTGSAPQPHDDPVAVAGEAPDDGSAEDPDTADLGPATEAMAPPASDHDGLTRSGDHLPPPYTPPGIPGQAQAPSVVSRPVARLVFSSGEAVVVDRAVVVGRAPEARHFPAAEQPHLVTVPSPHQEISSTHLEIRPGSGADHGSAVVTDLGSTNGTVLVQPGLPPEDLQAGVAVQLIPGAIIDLGDSVTIQVINP